MDATSVNASTWRGVAPRAKRGIFGRWKWRLWILGLDLLALAGMAVVWNWPLLKVKNIRVEGPTVWQEQARSLVVLPPDSNAFRVDPEATRERLAEAFGNRAGCQVKLELPSTLAIRLLSTASVLWADGASADGPLAVGPNGALLRNPLDQSVQPVWRSTASAAKGGDLTQRAKYAAGTWKEIIAADSRYQQVVSEWTDDPATGWSMTAADGRSQILLGKTALTERAATVARLLNERDSLLLRPCVIDARFEGLLAVRPSREPVDDSGVIDSLTSSSVPSAGETARVCPSPAARTVAPRGANPTPAPVRTRVKGRS